jgi:hypothetical protein
MSVHRTYPRIPTPEAPGVRRAGPEVPIQLFVGAWLLVLSWDTLGAVGLIFPGLFAWVAWAVALLRTIRRAPATARKAAEVAPVDKRVIRWLWIGCALFFVIMSGSELFVSRLMPDSWRQHLVVALHIRRVYRNYGP